jgi:hypothetical protein
MANPSAPVLAAGSAQALVKQSVGLQQAFMQPTTLLSRLSGPFPTDASIPLDGSTQTSTDYPILTNMDLTKQAGDRITFDFANPSYGQIFMGDSFAQGHGAQMSMDQDGLKINMTRYPVAGPSAMSQQRTLHNLRKLSTADAYKFIRHLQDQRTLVHLAGARGFQVNGEWKVPLASDPNFASIMVNTVRAPSHNRHFMCSGGEAVPFAAAANEVSMLTSDQISTNFADSIATIMKEMPFPLGGVKFDGDELAEDEILRICLCSPSQMTSLKQSPNYRQYLASSQQRAVSAKKNPLFLGENTLLFNGILFKELPKPIRFYAGDPINHCLSHTSQTETTTDLVPASFGTTHAIDRAIIVGAQALARAMGKAILRTEGGQDIDGTSVFYNEELMDHKTRLEVCVGVVDGMQKTRFLQDMGTGNQYTDFGTISLDTAVTLRGMP